jgi:hypothetical protein
VRSAINVATKPVFGAWPTALGDAKMTTAMLDSISYHGEPADNHFVLDCYVSIPGLVDACGFKGDGLKLAQAIGAALVDMALNNMTHLPVLFSQAQQFAKEVTGLSRPSSSLADALDYSANPACSRAWRRLSRNPASRNGRYCI